MAGTAASLPMIASIDAFDNFVTLYVYEPDGPTSLYTFAGGTFVQVGAKLATGPSPVQILSGDLDGDGLPDLVIRNAGDGTATVYLSNGRGGFTEAADSLIAIGEDASDIALADLDGSRRLDLVVSDEDRGEVGVLINQGNGTFAPPSEYRAGVGVDAIEADSVTTEANDGTSSVAVGVLRAGSPPDIVAVNPGSGTVSVLDGLGDATFANPSSTSTDPAQVVVVADLNGDGVPDLAMLGPDGLTIELGNGQGGFGVPCTESVEAGATGLSFALLAACLRCSSATTTAMSR